MLHVHRSSFFAAPIVVPPVRITQRPVDNQLAKLAQIAFFRAKGSPQLRNAWKGLLRHWQKNGYKKPMKIRRTVPPTAAPIKAIDLLHGLIGLVSNGKKYRKQLEREIKEDFSVKHVFLVSSGKAALALILLALQDLSKKKQVVIPAYTCFSVPSSVVKAGLEIIPCDIDPVTFDFDYECLERKVTNDTLCILAIHLFGIAANLDRIRTIGTERNTLVVEDAAQAMGGQYKSTMLGTIGDVGFYSLGRGKNITCGSGGIIVTDNDLVAAALTRHHAKLEESSFVEDLKNLLHLCLMSFFIRPSFYWIPVAMPFLKLGQTFFYKDFPIHKLSGRRAALLQSWRDRLAKSNHVRAQNSLELSNDIGNGDSIERCIPYLRLPIFVEDRKARDLIYARSREDGLGLSLMYPTAVNEIEELKTAFSGQVFPGAKKVAETLVTLPTHHLLTDIDKKAICGLLTSTASAEIPQVAISASEPA
jgi:perosamine synthetase